MAVMRYYQQWETAGRRDGWLAATGYDQLSASFLSRCRRCLPHYVAIKAWRDADPQRQRWNSPDLVWQKFQEATVDDAEGEGATVAVLSPVPVAASRSPVSHAAVVSRWLAERCVVDRDAWVRTAVLHRDFQQWAAVVDEFPLSQKLVVRGIKRRIADGRLRARYAKRSFGSIFAGIRLRRPTPAAVRPIDDDDAPAATPPAEIPLLIVRAIGSYAKAMPVALADSGLDECRLLWRQTAFMQLLPKRRGRSS